jgi:hypothetical protein
MMSRRSLSDSGLFCSPGTVECVCPVSLFFLPFVDPDIPLPVRFEQNLPDERSLFLCRLLGCCLHQMAHYRTFLHLEPCLSSSCFLGMRVILPKTFSWRTNAQNLEGPKDVASWTGMEMRLSKSSMFEGAVMRVTTRAQNSGGKQEYFNQRYLQSYPCIIYSSPLIRFPAPCLPLNTALQLRHLGI